MSKKQPAPRHIERLSLMLGASVSHFTQQKFHRCVAHLELMFLRQLRDVHQYSLDGSNLIFVYFGLPKAQAELFGQSNFYQMKKGNWSACCIPDFDPVAFFASGERQQDELITSLLELALVNAARLTGADPQPILDSADLIRSGDFMARFLISHLTLQNGVCGQTANVYSRVMRGMIQWQVDVIDADGKLTRREEIPLPTNWRGRYTEDDLTSHWDKSGFWLRAPNGKAYYRLPSKS